MIFAAFASMCSVPKMRQNAWQRTERMTALYAAADGFEPVRAAFITQDEIDEMLRSGSGIDRGKKRISEF